MMIADIDSYDKGLELLKIMTGAAIVSFVIAWFTMMRR